MTANLLMIFGGILVGLAVGVVVGDGFASSPTMTRSAHFTDPGNPVSYEVTQRMIDSVLSLEGDWTLRTTLDGNPYKITDLHEPVQTSTGLRWDGIGDMVFDRSVDTGIVSVAVWCGDTFVGYTVKNQRHWHGGETTIMFNEGLPLTIGEPT